MQVTTTVAQPPVASIAPAPMPKVLSILRADPTVPPAEADAPPPTDPATPPAPAPDAPTTGPVADAAAGATIFSRIGERQNRYLGNQQLLGAISQALTARVSQLGSQAWALLRGTATVDGQ